MVDCTTIRHRFSRDRSGPKRLAAAWFGTLALLAAATVLSAQGDRTPIASQLERAEQRLRSLQQEADQLAREERSLLGDIQRLEVARRITVEELARATAQVVDTQQKLTRINQQVAQLEAEARIEGPRLRARLAELYKLGRGRYVRVLFSTPSMRDARQAYRLVSAMARRDQERVAAHQKRLAAMTAAQQDIQARMGLLAAERRAAEQAAAAAAQAVTARDALVQQTDVRRDLNARLSGELLAAQQRLQGTLTSANPSPAPPLPFLAFRGDIDWPLAGPRPNILPPVSWRRPPTHQRRRDRGHRGFAGPGRPRGGRRLRRHVRRLREPRHPRPWHTELQRLWVLVSHGSVPRRPRHQGAAARNHGHVAPRRPVAVLRVTRRR